MTLPPVRPEVSIIVAAYNSENSVGRTLESALAQEGVTLETIVVDDDSSDGTAAVVANYERADPRVRLIRASRNRGPGPARNLALAQARGEWIAPLDADDQFKAGRLTSLLAVARERGADLVADNLWLCDGASSQPFDLMLQPNHVSTPTLVSAKTFVRNNFALNVKRKYGLLKPIIRRDFIEYHGIRYDEAAPYGEDFLLYLECLVRGAKFVLIPEAYYFYHLSRSSMTSVRSLDEAADFLRHCDTLLQREDVRMRPGLALALSEHSVQLRSDLVYLRFAAALKKNQPYEAIRVLASRPDLWPYILLHIRRTAILRCRQWAAGFRRQHT